MPVIGLKRRVQDLEAVVQHRFDPPAHLVAIDILVDDEMPR